ncbi:MAG: hypothetical protein KDE27_28825 [Planctomycetes bacterium]|nr:hypothetical protein [Planctomycetota bacterium]
MRKLLASIAVTTAAVMMTSCSAGPHQLKRTVDDWDHKMYVNNPWLNGVLWFVPVFPLCHFGASIGDFLVTDAYFFWFQDAWDMKGTGFKHADVMATDGQVGSLMGDGSFLKVMK